jgi:cyanophycin synthetase
MEILGVRALRGPNFWSRRTCLEALVDLRELKDSPSNTLPGFADRLEAWLPTLIEHRCGVGERGGFLMRLRDGTYLGHVLEHVTIELQNLSGTPVGFGKARETSKPGVYKVAFRYRDETVARACLQAAFQLILAAVEDRPFDVAGTVEHLKEIVDRHWLGPSTRAILAAAEARDIPWQRLNDGNLVQLGHGARARRVWTAETDRTSAIGETVSRDKELVRSLLEACGVPVPEGRAVTSAEDAWEAAQDMGLPVVVKPRDGNHGRGVSLDLATREEVEEAWRIALPEGSDVLVERCIRGVEHRLLVVGNRLVAAARGEEAWVTGDGASTVQALVDAQLNTDPRRGTTEEFPLNVIRLTDDPVCLFDLRRQGLSGPDAVPSAGARIRVQRNGNVVHDCTDQVHPRVAAKAVLAARIVGLDIAGVDLVAEDVSRPLEDQGGAIVEVNAGPGLLMHLRPASGQPRPVGEAIVGRVFPEGETGRIPLVCVTGQRGRTAAARRIARLLRVAGHRVGTAGMDGVRVGDRVLEAAPHADAPGARKILRNPLVDAAVLEADPEGILKEGLGFDRCQVAVVTDVGQPEGLGRHFVSTPEDLWGVLRCPVDVVPTRGTAVLNAEDERAADMARLCDGAVILYAAEPALEALEAHRAAGGRAVAARNGRILLLDGAGGEPVDVGSATAGTDGTGALLATAATGWALGLDVDLLRRGLRSRPGEDD